MRPRRWQSLTASAVLILAGLGASEVRAQAAPDAQAQTPGDLQQRVLDLEQSTREQVESLKRKIQELEAARDAEKRAQEEQLAREKEQRAQEQTARRGGANEFFDLQAGGQQSNATPQLGKDIKGNVYSSDAFKVKLGGSLRLHSQWIDKVVGESVARAPSTDPVNDREAFRTFASRTRLNLAIQGPETLGGKTQGFFEFDFNQNFGTGDIAFVNSNPRLRHAYGRWIFPDLLTKGDEFVTTFGQTGSFADDFPDMVDFNTLYTGLGATHRRNARIEFLERVPVTSAVKVVGSVGLERPLFGTNSQPFSATAGQIVGTDLSVGELGRLPAFSAGGGLEAGRIAIIDSTKVYVRGTYGRFRQRFDTAGTPNLLLPTTAAPTTPFIDRGFNNWTAHAGVTLDRIGFNTTGRAMTFKLLAGGVWTKGEAGLLNAEFDRQLILDDDNSLVPAQSWGGFVNPQFYLTDTLSLRWAGGIQFARDSDRPVVTGDGFTQIGGTLATNNFFRDRNRQSELSVWWTPGPFTFALAWQHTSTDFKRVETTLESSSHKSDENKVELITWFSF